MESVFAVVLLLIAAHAAAYLFVLRHRPSFALSGTIFQYHVWFAAAVGAVLALMLTRREGLSTPAASIGAVALVGIYSLSFLELWSLAEGGYSLSVLRYLNGRDSACEAEVHADLMQIGRAKQNQRLASLVALGLLRDGESGFSLTRRGRVVAAAARAVAAFSAIRERG